MAAVTLTKENEAVGQGNMPSKLCSAASIADGDTLESGFSEVTQVIASGLAASKALTWTQSNGTITFGVTTGPITNIDLLIFGKM